MLVPGISKAAQSSVLAPDSDVLVRSELLFLTERGANLLALFEVSAT